MLSVKGVTPTSPPAFLGVLQTHIHPNAQNYEREILRNGF